MILKTIAALLCLSIFLYSDKAIASNFTEIYAQNTARFLLIGESHLDDDSRSKFSDSLHIFKNHGGEILALEMIESHKQYLLDNYSEGFEGSEKELYDYLEERWQYNTHSYLKLIREAKISGLRIIAIDLDNTTWPAETTVFPVIPDISKVRAAREAHMAKILCDHKEFKTAVIIGRFHTVKRFLPKQLVRECGEESISLDLGKFLSIVN